MSRRAGVIFGLLVISVVALVLLQRRHRAPDPWLGRTVFWKAGAAGRVGIIGVDISKVPFPATVKDVNGEWLWLESAWVKKQDVLSTDDALKYYTDLINENAKETAWWGSRGRIWNEKGDLERAIRDYSEAIRLDPKYVFGFEQRGTLLREKAKLILPSAISTRRSD